jgi:hypothetical protein
MQIGDIVRVRATARRPRIIEDLGQSHYRVLFFADPAADALDRDTPQDEDDAGGVYQAETSNPTFEPEPHLQRFRTGVS